MEAVCVGASFGVLGRSFAAYLRAHNNIIVLYSIICELPYYPNRGKHASHSFSRPATSSSRCYCSNRRRLQNTILYTILQYIGTSYCDIHAIYLYIAPFSSGRGTQGANLQYRRSRNPQTIQIRAFPSAVVALHIYEVFQDCGQQLAQCARPTPARSTWWRHQRTAWTRRATYFNSGGVNNRL